MKNVLLLTDFSDNSINAIHYAMKLFHSHRCIFHILHVEPSNSYLTDNLMAAGNKSIYDSLVKDSKTKLTHLANQLKKTYTNENYTIDTLIDHDVFIDSVKQVINAKSIDFIVMGTNGVTGAKEVVFGSNTINVIRKVNCPTLVIPEGFVYRSPKEVLLPLDIYDSLASEAFKELLNFSNQYSHKLHLIRVLPNNEDYAEKKDNEHIESHLRGTSYEYHVIKKTPMDHVVNSYIQTHNIDLITLLVQKESLFERFFIGSSTTQISNKLKVPLLVYHS